MYKTTTYNKLIKHRKKERMKIGKKKKRVNQRADRQGHLDELK